MTGEQSPRINLAICVPGEIYGGVERFVLSLARYLQNRSDVTPLVVLFHEGKPLRELEANGIETHVVSHRRKYDPRVITELYRIFKSRNINVVHTNGYKATILAGLAAKLCGARIVKTEHGLLEPGPYLSLSRHRMRLNLLIDRIMTGMLVDHVVYVTNDLQTHYQRLIRSRASSVIYNGVEPISDTRQHPPDIDGAAFNIGIIGRLCEVKGHRILLAALTQLQDLPDIKLNIIGVGPLRTELEEYCRHHRILHTVAFLGFKENIRDYIAALDVLAIPSLYEGLPYVLLESMSSGAPVIAARVGGIREILEHKKDSLLIEPGNDRELAETIRFLYNHPKVRIRLARDAFEKVNDSFMVGNMASLYLTLYRKVCSGHSSTTHVPKILTEHPLSCPCHEDSNNELRPHQ